MKTCTKCGIAKAIDLFVTARNCKDGHAGRCKACDKIQKAAWYQAHRPQADAQSKAWFAAHPDKLKEVMDKASAKFIASGKSAAAKREWRKANPEKQRAMQQRSDAVLTASGAKAAYRRQWRKKNYVRSLAQVNARNSRRREACPPWADMAAIKRVYAEAARQGMQVDHIVPLIHPHVCGLHVPWNLQLLTQKANASKGNSFNGGLVEIVLQL